MKHTEGEWKHDTPVFRNDEWKCRLGGDGKYLATIHGDSAEMCEANAKLISAAPDLLKTLKHLIANCEEISPGMPNMLEAKAAVKKATE